jgi:hypothetical protein
MKIEENVPLPFTHLLAQMNLGDSIAVPAEKYEDAYRSAVNYGIRTGTKFIRKMNKDGSGRIWRSK